MSSVLAGDQTMTDPYQGKKTRSFKLSDEFDDLLRVVAVHEGRSVSQLIRRALSSYCLEGGYFTPQAADELAGHRVLVSEQLEGEDG